MATRLVGFSTNMVAIEVFKTVSKISRNQVKPIITLFLGLIRSALAETKNESRG